MKSALFCLMRRLPRLLDLRMRRPISFLRSSVEAVTRNRLPSCSRIVRNPILGEHSERRVAAISQGTWAVLWSSELNSNAGRTRFSTGVCLKDCAFVEDHFSIAFWGRSNHLAKLSHSSSCNQYSLFPNGLPCLAR